MKNLLTAAIAVIALAPLGCNNPQGGSSGTKDNFTVDVSTSQAVMGTALKKGETKEIDLTIKPDKEFKGKVTLKADHPDKFKTELNPSSVDVNPGQNATVKMMVTNEGAPAGDATIRVTATPDHGSALSKEVKVKAE